jgi:hypothetical protein
MSGKSNVIFWLERKGLGADDETVDRIFQKAKQSNRTLLDREIIECLPSGKRPTVASAD